MSKQVAKGKSNKPTSSKKKSSGSDDFVSDDVVSGGSSNYLKFQDGDNKFRFISKPIFGWLVWEDNKPVRSHIDDEPEGDFEKDNKPKKFMAAAVIDREDEQVKILEITQQSVIKAVKALAANEDWGNPFTYDINVAKSGESLKTKYAVTPSPKKPLSKELIKAAEAKPCNLDALYEGLDPWDTEDGETEYILK